MRYLTLLNLITISMKKIYNLFFSLLVLLTVSCSNEETLDNSLVGTKWTTSYGSNIMVIEFTSNEDVVGYFAKPSGVYYCGMVDGTYTLKDNTVYFANMTFDYGIHIYYKLQTATINGNLMSSSGMEIYDLEKGVSSYNWNEFWSKFNL